MRGNTNPCTLCEYCDDSCDVCLHQSYENTDSSYYCGTSSSDEAEPADASTDVGSGSDEEGSWFTTPWSKLIAQRVLGYEIDPEIGVQLHPIEDQGDGNQGDGRMEEELQGERNEEGQKKSGRRRRLRRRRRRNSVKDEKPEEAVKEEATEEAKEEAEVETKTEEQKANEDEQKGKESQSKDIHENTWLESVVSSVSQVTVS